MAHILQSESRRYTYADLAEFPDDRYRREIIDGELIVTVSPVPRHQKAVMNISGRLYGYRQTYGGEVYPAPLDVYFAEDSVVEPDVLFIRAEHLGQIGDKYVSNAPDLVVEVSSPTTRRLELVRKRELYERFGVPEYWYVDLEAERVEQYVLTEGRYPPPTILYPDQVLESAQLIGFSIEAKEALASGPEPEAEADP
ncbi:MAG: Uma2 family endonuclease [Actinobacteria bacterium]|nr:Uma2 family endonuclease [Actinomycetota bacterium]